LEEFSVPVAELNLEGKGKASKFGNIKIIIF